MTETIYEAAFLPDLWQVVLEKLAVRSDSVGAAIFLFAHGLPARGRALPHQGEMLAEFLSDNELQLSAGVTRMCSVQPASFVDVDRFMMPHEIETDPVRVKFRAMGIGAHLCTAIPMPSGELGIFVLQRALDNGQYERSNIDALDLLRPHLARASLVASRLGLQQAENTVAAMEAMGLPAAVLSSHGRVLAANSLFDGMSSLFLPVAFGGLAISDSAANRLFQLAISAAGSNTEPLVRSIPVTTRNDGPTMIIHVLPLRRAARDIFSGADILVAATSVGKSVFSPSAKVLNALFDLTPAEANLATALSAGRSLKEAAFEASITVKSARTYLERIFTKTGTKQQSQLVALLKSAETFR
ncbi:helix-turn-helix transcriptional regulator [Shinella sp. CPCC 101442]|uniref:helix-turn-helix transcriptional regulator n=1 Tax=Shinella sp. CPCC 101442 TaxID=2932265 RepID=UPI0021527B17|nr:helix-turn-helix transcriptional regulator [Shinella sp. CPCC 101442]MCR6501355.1 helix-turn-helix transcriptional regulator [Shinella sp. CPCC 101442]